MASYQTFSARSGIRVHTFWESNTRRRNMNTTAPTGLLQQPRPFFMIFFVELWERFGYYGVQGILAVFFVKQLGFSQEQAFITFGAFAALVYGLIAAAILSASVAYAISR